MTEDAPSAPPTAPPTGPTVVKGVQGLLERAGSDLGVSDWVPVRQESVDTFARLTGDEQWIHVDPERAANGPFGTTVQHGFLTLGLSTGLLDHVVRVDDVSVVLNYGLDRVRFPAPLKVGSRTRMHVSLADVREVTGGVQVVYHLVYEVEGESKPCCVADLVFRYHS
jgi:acyl dehydratase